jgi:hypothetical protein
MKKTLLHQLLLSTILIFIQIRLPFAQTENFLPSSEGKASQNSLRDLGRDFGDRAYQHVSYLSGLGIRKAASLNEQKAIQYVAVRLQEAGLMVSVEPFEFGIYEMTEASLTIGGRSYDPALIGFNPYEDPLGFSGEGLVIRPDQQLEEYGGPGISESTVITEVSPNNLAYFRLLPYKPKLVIMLKHEDFQSLSGSDSVNFDLEVRGKQSKLFSGNVVAKVSKAEQFQDDILICAHLDSYKNSPGGDDNGSGVGVLIELARFFQSQKEALTSNLIFLFPGAEEVGALGARMYLKSHEPELKNCKLIFNIDRVGGNGETYIEALGGVRGVPLNGIKYQIPERIADKAWEGLETGWILNQPGLISILQASRRPEWMLDIIQNSISETGLEASLTGSMGGDSIVFSQAGIVASGISRAGSIVHSPLDLASQVRIGSLQECGTLTASIILNAMRSDRFQIH